MTNIIQIVEDGKWHHRDRHSLKRTHCRIQIFEPLIYEIRLQKLGFEQGEFYGTPYREEDLCVRCFPPVPWASANVIK